MSFGHHNEHNRKSYHKPRQEPDSIIPPDILQSFDEGDIPKVWETLDKVFHVNVKHWEQKFLKAYYESQPMSKQEVFFQFLKKHLEKPINLLRGNREYDVVIEKIVRYSIREKIERRKNENDPVRKTMMRFVNGEALLTGYDDTGIHQCASLFLIEKISMGWARTKLGKAYIEKLEKGLL